MNMIPRTLLLLGLVLAAGLGPAQERVVLTVPVFVSAGATDFRVASIELRRSVPEGPVPLNTAAIVIVFRQVDAAVAFVPGGKAITCAYHGTVAEPLLVALNKANLSTISLEKRVTQQCQADGQLGAGTIAGVPQ